MRTLFIEAKFTGKPDFSRIKYKALPKKVGLVASVQFAGLLEGLAALLLQHGIKGSIAKGRQKFPGQILGCDASAASSLNNKVDAFIYVGDGKFHPIAAAIESGKPVFCLNPKSGSFSKLEDAEIERIRRRRKAAMLKFLAADDVGVIVSTKPGQRCPEAALASLEKKYPAKRFYRFMCNTLDFAQLESFPFIKSWVNTACPRIEDDLLLVNLREL